VGLIYLPFAKTVCFLEKLRLDGSKIPLSVFRHLTFYSIKADVLDRFGARLEQRITKGQVQKMVETVGFRDIVFSNEVSYLYAIGMRAGMTSGDS